uniref:Uncharacterized protein n=1 Tax=Romanomermis culicivorax TaxID=13658 RepID=A0A915K563_ROMCU
MSLPSIAALLDKGTIDQISDYGKDWAQYHIYPNKHHAIYCHLGPLVRHLLEDVVYLRLPSIQGLSYHIYPNKHHAIYCHLGPLVRHLLEDVVYLRLPSIQGLSDFGLLYHKIPFDRHFMKNTLARVLETDTFTKRLYDIYEEVFDSMHRTQPHVLTIQRADYMFHLIDDCPNGDTQELMGDDHDCRSWSSKYVLKQVEK